MHTDVDGGAGKPAIASGAPGKGTVTDTALVALPRPQVAQLANLLPLLIQWAGDDSKLSPEQTKEIDHWSSPAGVMFGAGALLVCNNLACLASTGVETLRVLERIEKLLERLNDSLDDEVIELTVTGEAVPS